MVNFKGGNVTEIWWFTVLNKWDKNNLTHGSDPINHSINGMLDLFELLESTNELRKVLVILWRKTREYANRYEICSEKTSSQSTSSSDKLCAMKRIFYHHKMQRVNYAYCLNLVTYLSNGISWNGEKSQNKCNYMKLYNNKYEKIKLCLCNTLYNLTPLFIVSWPLEWKMK